MNKDVELIKSDGTYVKVKDIKNGTLLFTPSGKTATKGVDFLIEMIKVEKINEKELCYTINVEYNCNLMNSDFFIV